MALCSGDWPEARSVLVSRSFECRCVGCARKASRSILLVRTFAACQRGAGTRPDALLEELLGTLGDGSLPLVELWLRPECVLCHARETNLDGAHLHLARCREIIGAGKDWLGFAGAVAHTRAVAAAMEKRLPEAETFFERAIATFTRYSLPWEQAETLLQWGRVLAAGDEHRANEKFDAAIRSTAAMALESDGSNGYRKRAGTACSVKAAWSRINLRLLLRRQKILSAKKATSGPSPTR